MKEQELVEWYQRFGYLVFRRCLALTGNRVDAEDAMQEVFMRAQRFDRPDTSGPALGWLYTLANNCCFDLLKKHRRADPQPNEVLASLDQRTTGEAGADDRAALRVALRQVDETTRHIGLLHHLGGLTQEEIAAETGISRKTIGRKLQSFEVALRGNDGAPR